MLGAIDGFERALPHYLRPLVSPASVALVGASERPGSVGRIVLANMQAGGYAGAIHAINPGRDSVLGLPALRSLRDLPQAVDLALIATPADTVPGVLRDAGARGIRFALVMTAPPAADAERWHAEVRAIARREGVRMVGAGAFGLVRTDIGLNATFCAPVARAGHLALVAQSGAVATALLDFAAPQHLGFSTVISLGTGLDIGFGDMLDVLAIDPLTEGILLFLEGLADARRFVSALRGAARVKPVVVLKAGRSLEPPREPATDRVFDAALARAGAVRVQNYTELFAAARILASGRIPRTNRLAIVSNGRGPALLAADRVATRAVSLASFSPESVEALDTLLPEGSARGNPVDLRGDAVPPRLAAAVQVVLDDPGVDAVLALHVPRPAMPALAAAEAVATVARTSRKLVLGAWLGALDRPDVHAALETGGIANFFTPENAVDALSFLAAYRRSQALLLEVPALQPEPELLDAGEAQALRQRLLAEGRDVPTVPEAVALLRAFGLAVASDAFAPVEPPLAPHAGVALGLATDPVFGPVLTVGLTGHLHEPEHVAVMLPPLNTALAGEVVHEARRRNGMASATGADTPGTPDTPGAPASRGTSVTPGDAPFAAALVSLLLRMSTLAAALPWVTRLTLDVVPAAGGARVAGARLATDPARAPMRGYRHMAIHPYPVELVEHVVLRDGTSVTIRPIRPEDAELERRFVEALSPQARFFRFFHRISELTPAMIARFTQVDYDRELALVAVADHAAPDGGRAFVGVARYSGNPDGESAEFAIVVADAWQRHGVARALMGRLIVAARERGYARLEGSVLRDNAAMMAFTASLGFHAVEDPDASDQWLVRLDL